MIPYENLPADNLDNIKTLEQNLLSCTAPSCHPLTNPIVNPTAGILSISGYILSA